MAASTAAYRIGSGKYTGQQYSVVQVPASRPSNDVTQAFASLFEPLQATGLGDGWALLLAPEGVYLQGTGGTAQ